MRSWSVPSDVQRRTLTLSPLDMHMPSKKVGFFGNPSVLQPGSKDNTGNMIHGYAARAFFQAPAKVAVARDEANLERIRAECSHVAFVMATTIHPKSPPPNFETRQSVTDFIEALGLPMCVFGLGCHASLDQTIADANVDPVTVRMLQVISSHSAAIAVRGAFTADLCAKYGVKNVEVVGCQSTYLAGMANWGQRFDPALAPQRPAVNMTLSVNEEDVLRLAMDRGCDVIGQNDHIAESIAQGTLSRERYLSAAPFAGEPAYLGPLFRQGELSRETYFDYVRDHFHKFYNVPTWLAHMKSHYDFCFGTRFHGNMAAFMAGVPALWLSHDMRTQELCDHLGLPHVAHSRLGEFGSVSDLAARCSYDTFWARFPQRLREFRSYLDHNGMSPLLKPQFVADSDAIIGSTLA